MHLVGERELQRDRGTDRLTRRAEDGERLVPPQLDHLAAVSLHALARDLRERRREVRGRLVATRLGERRVAADVRDQKSQNPNARSLTGANRSHEAIMGC